MELLDELADAVLSGRGRRWHETLRWWRRVARFASGSAVLALPLCERVAHGGGAGQGSVGHDRREKARTGACGGSEPGAPATWEALDRHEPPPWYGLRPGV